MLPPGAAARALPAMEAQPVPEVHGREDALLENVPGKVLSTLEGQLVTLLCRGGAEICGFLVGVDGFVNLVLQDAYQYASGESDAVKVSMPGQVLVLGHQVDAILPGPRPTTW